MLLTQDRFKFHFLFFALLLSTQFSCHSKKENGFQDFQSTPSYSLASIKKNYEGIFKPWDISSIDDHLVIAENRRNSPEFPLIHVLEKGTLNYLFSKGKSGFGPLEIVSASSVEPGFLSNTFQVYCPMNKKFVTFSLSDTSKLGISEYKQPDELFGMYMMFHASDSTILGIMADDPHRLVEYSSVDGKRIDGYGTWERIPNADHLIDYEDPDINYHMGEINKGRLRANRDLGLFVKAMGFRDRIEIFHYPSKTFIIVDGPRSELHPFKIERSQGRSAVIFELEYPFGYADAEISENFIFALFSNLTTSQMMNSDDIAKTIYVFSHKGDLVGKLDLDRSVRSIAVDEGFRQLYGITTDGDPGIAVFDLPKELWD
ncbi:BF3164 family lipoprotein [Algoriphagus confluentis]|uniref:TolB-like 6-blade propeller-like n=1 Tax=Algoriphagus confluentis TaxID=1697556 RepID=A0ABQ6PNV3_9BACT|nr:hypothetical protein Aconfl_19990 [Algoriphagus confluentis]